MDFLEDKLKARAVFVKNVNSMMEELLELCRKIADFPWAFKTEKGQKPCRIIKV